MPRKQIPQVALILAAAGQTASAQLGPTRDAHSVEVCLPEAHSFPGLPPYPLLQEDRLLGISSEWLVYSSTIFNPIGEVTIHTAYSFLTEEYVRTGLVPEVGVAAYSPEGNFLFEIHNAQLHTFDLRTRSLVATGIETDWRMASGPGATCLFQSKETTVDENGDGDLDDFIVYAGDLVTGTLSSSGRALNENLLASISGPYAVWLVQEAPGMDRTGDGDFDDEVYFAYDFAAQAGKHLNLAWGERISVTSDDHLAFHVSEASQGADLNGDGDQLDRVLHLLEYASRSVTNLMVEAYEPTFADGKLIYNNLDTQTMQIRNLPTGVVTDLGLPVASTARPNVSKGFLLFASPEENVDWNGDGDLLDIIPWLHELATGQTFHLGVAGGAWDVEGRDVLFARSEPDEGVDLNGDGDTTDFVWALYDIPTGHVRSLGYAAGGPGSIHGDFLALNISEGGEGRDLDGDGQLFSVIGTMPRHGAPRLRVSNGQRVGWNQTRFETIAGLGLFATGIDVVPESRIVFQLMQDCSD